MACIGTILQNNPKFVLTYLWRIWNYWHMQHSMLIAMTSPLYFQHLSIRFVNMTFWRRLFLMSIH